MQNLESESVVPGKCEHLQGARKDDRFRKLERARSGTQLRDVLLKSLMAWRKTLGCAEVYSPCRAACRAVCGVKPPPVHPSSTEHVKGKDESLQDRVLVPDDTGKCMAWWVPRQQYSYRNSTLFSRRQQEKRAVPSISGWLEVFERKFLKQVPGNIVVSRILTGPSRPSVWTKVKCSRSRLHEGRQRVSTTYYQLHPSPGSFLFPGSRSCSGRSSPSRKCRSGNKELAHCPC